MLKKFFYSLVCLSIVVASTARTQNITVGFDETLNQWLGHMGFKGSVLEYQKIYDNIGYLDYFKILLKEKDPENTKYQGRTETKFSVEVTDNEEYEFLTIKLMEKDIKGMPYMYADWIARFAISYAIKNVSKLLGLKAKTEKIKDGLYKITIDPATTTEPSRYRFTQLEVFYQVKNLFLNLDITLKGEKEYLILAYLKSELNGILRALENGHFPESTFVTLISGLIRQPSDQLLRDLLKVPEVSQNILSTLGNNPSEKLKELDPEFEF